jgi:hypothetical protein
MTPDLYPLQGAARDPRGMGQPPSTTRDRVPDGGEPGRGQLRGRRLRLTDDQRQRLAAKGRRLGRRVLRQVATIVTPDTIDFILSVTSLGDLVSAGGREVDLRTNVIPGFFLGVRF